MLLKTVLSLYPAKQQKLVSTAGIVTDFFILSFLWGLAVILVDFTGDFPLNDDWSYGIAAKRLAEEGVFDPTLWTSMSLLTQVLWGAFFSFIFGFSFEVLRLSTIVISLLALFSIYLLVRQLQQPRIVALFVPLVLAFNPVYFHLSYTFMTDVPFLGFTVFSMLFFLRYLQSESGVDLLLGTIFTIIAILCRQNGLFVPIAFALTLIYKNGFRFGNIFRAVLPGFLGLSSLLIFQYWLKQTGKLPEMYGKQIHDLLDIVLSPDLWPAALAKSFLTGFMYLGLFLLPVFILMFAAETRSELNAWIKRMILRAAGPLSVIFGLALFLAGKIMPLGGNVLHKAGIGPLTLEDTHFMQLPNVEPFPEIFWAAVTLLSIVGASVLLVYLASVAWAIGKEIYLKKHSLNHTGVIFFLTGMLIYSFPIVFLGFYDRYLLIPMVLIMLVMLAITDKFKLKRPKLMMANGIFLVALAIFCIAGTHDYLSWNRARWEGLQELTEDGSVPYAQINGGFEYNGMALFTDEANRSLKTDVWWTEEDDIYMFTFGNVPGYEAVKSYAYERWLHPGEGQIFLLRRQGNTGTEAGLTP